MGDSGNDVPIELSEAVRAVRDGLLTAAASSTGSPVVFELGEIQMEFTVEVRKDVKGRSGVNAWVVDAGAEASRGSSRVHKVAFTLKPVDARTGGPWRVRHETEGSTARFGRGDGTP